MTPNNPPLARQRARYLLGFARSVGLRTPIALFTFGKVGSTTVMRALEATGGLVIHTHAITKTSVAAAVAPYLQNPRAGLPSNAWRGEYLRWRWKILGRYEDRHIVTVVRDPIARNLSAFFQVAETYGLLDLSDPSSLDAGEVIHTFLNEFNEHRGPLDWYAREFLDATGVDVYALAAPRDGRAVHHELGRTHLTILRTEDLREVDAAEMIEPVVACHGPRVEVKGPCVADANRTDRKPVAALYADVLERIRLPADYVDTMYSSTFCRHFYTSSELDRLRVRWLSGKAAS